MMKRSKGICRYSLILFRLFNIRSGRICKRNVAWFSLFLYFSTLTVALIPEWHGLYCEKCAIGHCHCCDDSSEESEEPEAPTECFCILCKMVQGVFVHSDPFIARLPAFFPLRAPKKQLLQTIIIKRDRYSWPQIAAPPRTRTSSLL